MRAWLVQNFHIALIGLAMLGVVSFATLRSFERAAAQRAQQAREEEARREERERSELQQRQAWPAIEFTLLPKGTPPSVPVLSSLDRSDWFNERIRILVQNHPEEVIRTEMNAEVESLRLSLNGQNGIGTLGEFRVVHRRDIEFATRGTGGRETLPVFAIDPGLLAHMSSPRDIREAMLVVFHEYRHYQQWRELGPDSEWMFMHPDLRKVVDVPNLCECSWKRERDAYERECQLAVSWGMEDFVSGLCATVATPAAFSQRLFALMTAEKSGFSRTCQSVWARLAGHPNPEAFR